MTKSLVGVTPCVTLFDAGMTRCDIGVTLCDIGVTVFHDRVTMFHGASPRRQLGRVEQRARFVRSVG